MIIPRTNPSDDHPQVIVKTPNGNVIMTFWKEPSRHLNEQALTDTVTGLERGCTWWAHATGGKGRRPRNASHSSGRSVNGHHFHLTVTGNGCSHPEFNAAFKEYLNDVLTSAFAHHS